MSKRAEIFKQVGSYTVSTYAAQFITVFGSVLAKYFLGPVNTGIWTALQMILDFSKYSGLGVNTVLNLDVPYHQAKGDSARVSETVNTVFTFLCFSSMLIGLAVLTYALFRGPALSRELFWGLIFASVLILIQRLNNFFVTLLRAFKNFETASRQNIYSALVNVFLIGFLASQFKIYGFLWAIGLSLIFNIVYIQWKEKYLIRLSFRIDILKKTVASGLPLMTLGIVDTFFRSIDKFMILQFLGFKAMGLYSIGQMAANYLNSLHVSIAVVLLPHFQEKFGKNDNRKDLRDYFEHGMHGFSNLFPPLIALTWVLAPFFTHTVLSLFAEGLPALKWIVLGIYFVSLGNLCSNYLVTIKDRKRVLFSLLAASFFALALGIQFIQKGWGVAGIAAASMFASWFSFSLLFRASMPGVYAAAEAWKLYGTIMFKFILLVTVLTGIDYYVLHDGSSILRTLAALLIVCVASFPLLFSLNKKLNLMDVVKKRFARGKP